MKANKATIRLPRAWTISTNGDSRRTILRFVRSGCGFASFLLGGGYGLLLGFHRDIDAFRANEADVGDAEEPEGGLQIVFLMVNHHHPGTTRR